VQAVERSLSVVFVTVAVVVASLTAVRVFTLDANDERLRAAAELKARSSFAEVNSWLRGFGYSPLTFEEFEDVPVGVDGLPAWSQASRRTYLVAGGLVAGVLLGAATVLRIRRPPS